MIKRRWSITTVPAPTGVVGVVTEQPVPREVRRSSFQAYEPDICPFKRAQPMISVSDCGLCHGQHVGSFA
jgi:hypothetical protein